MLLLFVLLVLGAFLLERASLKDELPYISYTCRPDRRQTEPGQPFTITTALTNRRRLPVAFLRLEEQFPPSLAIKGEGLGLRSKPDSLLLCSTVFLMPREILTRKITVSLPERGRYIFRGALIYAGDFLGLQERGRQFRQTEEIVVYPAAAKNQALPQVLGSFLGDQSVRRFILEDPILTLGFREYTGHEPQRSISWPQSLAKGRLMVKQYDYTQDLSVTVLLNTDCGIKNYRDPQLIEEAFSLARSVCENLEAKKIRYSFLTNATTAGAMGQWSFLPAGLGGQHFYTIMEGLGRATYDHREPCSSLLKRAEKRGDHGQAHILITPRQSPRLLAMVKRLEVLSGGKVCLLSAVPGAASGTASGAASGAASGVASDTASVTAAGVAPDTAADAGGLTDAGDNTPTAAYANTTANQEVPA